MIALVPNPNGYVMVNSSTISVITNRNVETTGSDGGCHVSVGKGNCRFAIGERNRREWEDRRRHHDQN
jgi:hypothetical protein